MVSSDRVLTACLARCYAAAADLWDVEQVQEFFNLEDMERGKSYAERAHSLAATGLK